jgi:hypothetical protein
MHAVVEVAASGRLAGNAVGAFVEAYPDWVVRP